MASSALLRRSESGTGAAADGALEEAVEHLVRASTLVDVGERLGPVLDAEFDRATGDGSRRGSSEQVMDLITHRESPPGG